MPGRIYTSLADYNMANALIYLNRAIPEISMLDYNAL